MIALRGIDRAGNALRGGGLGDSAPIEICLRLVRPEK